MGASLDSGVPAGPALLDCGVPSGLHPRPSNCLLLIANKIQEYIHKKRWWVCGYNNVIFLMGTLPKLTSQVFLSSPPRALMAMKTVTVMAALATQMVYQQLLKLRPISAIQEFMVCNNDIARCVWMNYNTKQSTVPM